MIFIFPAELHFLNKIMKNLISTLRRGDRQYSAGHYTFSNACRIFRFWGPPNVWGPLLEGEDKMIKVSESLKLTAIFNNLQYNYKILEIMEKISEKCKIFTKFFVLARAVENKNYFIHN